VKLIKLGIISIVLLFVLVTIISLFIPSRVRISKAIDISGDKDELVRQISDTSNWKNWFFGEHAPTRQLQITKRAVESITAESVNQRARPVTSTWNFTDYPGSGVVTLQWSMDFRFRWYPWEKFSSLLLEKTYGERMAASLERLKFMVER
jgi:hypothetical protein